MRMLNISKSLLLATSLLFAIGAFAADKGTLRVYEPLTVAGKQLTAGNYKVEWQGNGPAVELNILRNNKVVATTPARLVDIDHASTGDLTRITTNSDGSVSLSQIQFHGKKYAVQIGDSAQTETASSAK